MHGSVNLLLRDGRPIVDGVYVNGRGPFRFLLDTGSNINLIDLQLAGKIGMITAEPVQLSSAAGKTSAAQSSGNEIVLDTVKASDQRFLASRLDAIHASSPDVEGVLGNWFLARFDYKLDFQMHTLTFDPRPDSNDLGGWQVTFRMVNLRPVITTSLGDLALDSGQLRIVLFGISPDGARPNYEMHTEAGAQEVGEIYGRKLLIAGEKIWKGNAIAVSTRPEADIDGLLPLSIFRQVYFCNSGGYLIFR